MTRAPDNLLAARRLLLDHLDMTPGRTVRSDLDPAEVGIVGDNAHIGGYHCGSDRVRRVGREIRDYSVTESGRDRAGLSDLACALDIGEFRRTFGGRTYDLPHLSAWIVGQCKAGTPDSRDIREVIWSPDGRTVKRWDRLGKRSSGDDSHRWHTHISYFRDAIKAGRDQTGLIRRYLTTIGLLAGEDDEMSAAAERTITNIDNAILLGGTSMGRKVPTPVNKGSVGNALVDKLDYALAQIDAISERLDAATAAEVARDAELRNLVERATSGELAAYEVVRRIGELLTAASS